MDDKFVQLYLETMKENQRLKNMLCMPEVRRGDVIYLKEDLVGTNITSFKRPFVVVSNNTGNLNSSIVLAVPLTSKDKKDYYPTHCLTPYHDSIALCEQIHTISRDNIANSVFHIFEPDMQRIDECLKSSLSLS